MDKHLYTAITAALEAGKAIHEIYQAGDFDVQVKGDNSPLTKADMESHHKIAAYLEKTNIPITTKIMPFILFIHFQVYI
mgnify:CR=1 FL=1